MSSNARIPVIIDTDPGVDDALALLLAGASSLKVLAVTTVAGNVTLDQATENARRLVPIAWPVVPPPIYRGETGGYVTAEHVHGADGLSGATELTANGAPVYPPTAAVHEGEAADVIARLARRYPRQVTLITLGPLTNVALGLRRDPEGMALLKRVVLMGGAFREAGNVTPTAEFNIYADPEAAQAVAMSGLPQLWVPVDVTHRCILHLTHLGELPDTPQARCARDVTEAYLCFHAQGYDDWACFLHDPLAVGAVLWPELLRTTPLHVEVETEGRLTRGMTVADFRARAYQPPLPPNADVCLEVDADEFVRRFRGALGKC